MTTFNTDQILGLAFSAAVTFSFISTSNVQAAPTFPPQHLDPQATFSEVKLNASGEVQRPWYRRDGASTDLTRSIAAAHTNRGVILADRIVGPWYRAAN